MRRRGMSVFLTRSDTWVYSISCGIDDWEERLYVCIPVNLLGWFLKESECYVYYYFTLNVLSTHYSYDTFSVYTTPPTTVNVFPPPSCHVQHIDQQQRPRHWCPINKCPLTTATHCLLRKMLIKMYSHLRTMQQKSSRICTIF